MLELEGSIQSWDYKIIIFIKYQRLDIDFLVIWLALYSRYKSYIL